MKSFLLFGGQAYYARGGWNDFVEGFDSIEEAKIKAESLRVQKEREMEGFEWWHVVDASTRQIIFRSKGRPYGEKDY